MCNMLYLDGKTTLRPAAKQGIDLYDIHCLQGPPASPTTNNCLSKDGSVFSRYMYSKQMGEPSKEHTVVALSKCLELCLAAGEQCEGVNYNRRNGNCALFEKVIGGVERDDHIDFYKNVCVLEEVDTGASSAANVPKEPVIIKPKGNGTASAAAGLGKVSNNIHEPDPRFQPDNGVLTNNVVQGVRTATAQQQSKTDSSFSISKSSSNNIAPPVLIPPGAVHTICNYEGIKVQIKHDQPFSGVVFVKNKYDSCRVEVGNSDSATLVLGLPSNFGMKPILLNGAGASAKPATNASARFEAGGGGGKEGKQPLTDIRRRRQTERDCGLVDMDNGTYKTTVVVQTNNLGIPGLVTSMDQLYEISCNYSSMLGGKVTAAANLTVHGPQPSLIQPRGKIELGNPVLMQMVSAGNGDHQALMQAKLGDILELRWEIMAMDEELDFLVKDCYAEPGINGGVSLTGTTNGGGGGNEKLQLIEAGCPTPAVAHKLIPNPIQVQSSAVKVAHMQAFRFDSSSTVRVTCHLEICKGECKPASCSLGGKQKDSWGRKKRSTDNSVTEFETKRYKVPRYAQATTSLVIIDPHQHQPQTVVDPAASSSSPVVNMQKHSPQEFFTGDPKYNSIAAAVEKTPVDVHSANSNEGTGAAAAAFFRLGVVGGARVGASHVGQMCMNKWSLMGVLGTLFALIVIQALIVTKYMFKRIFFEGADALSSHSTAAMDSHSSTSTFSPHRDDAISPTATTLPKKPLFLHY